jgi:hypothetical protein
VKARRQHRKFRTGGDDRTPAVRQRRRWFLPPGSSERDHVLVGAAGVFDTCEWSSDDDPLGPSYPSQPHDARGGVQPVENMAAAPNGAPIWCKPLNRSVFASVTAL